MTAILAKSKSKSKKASLSSKSSDSSILRPFASAAKIAAISNGSASPIHSLGAAVQTKVKIGAADDPYEKKDLFARESKKARELESLLNGWKRSVNARLGFGQATVGGATYGPTKMHREQLEIGVEQLGELEGELAAITGESLPALEAQLDAARIPLPAISST